MMADQPDAVEEARRKALEDERRGNDIDSATGNPIHREDTTIEDRKIEKARRDNPMNIPPGVPGSPGQPTDPPIVTGDPANSPLAADSAEAAEHLRSRRDPGKLGEIDGETKFAVDRTGRRTEEVGTVIDGSVPPDDLAATNEGRAEARATAEENNARIQREAEERQRAADRDAEERQRQANADAQRSADEAKAEAKGRSKAK